MKKYSLLLVALLFLFSCGSDGSDGDDGKQDLTIFPGIGITNVSIGDTGQDVFDNCGSVADSYISFGSGYTHFLSYLKDGLTFYLETYDSEDLDLTKPVTRIQIDSPSTARTESNIGVGSSKSDVIAAYGDPISSGIFGDEYDGMTIDYDDADLVESIEIQ